MRLTAIEIKNFRQYEELSFAFPQNSDYDLHIIIADNGVGKTNILNAITWCLYEKETHLGNESKSLPKLNLNAKKRAIENDITKIDVIVKIYAEDGDNSFVFTRSMSVNTSNDFESKSIFTVLVNSGEGDDIVQGEDAVLLVDKYMPKRIQQYFYFDGEQLDSYFIGDDRIKIKETIHSISQVDIVSRVKARLGEVIAAYRVDAGKKAPNVKVHNDKVKEIETIILNLKKDITEIEEQIKVSQKVITENQEKLSGQENVPELEKRYEHLQDKKKELEEAVHKSYSNLYKFIRGAKIALSLYEPAKNTLDIINEKEQKNALPPNIDKKLLQSILSQEHGNCIICGQPLEADAKQHIQSLIDQIQVSSETSNILMRIRSELERIVDDARSYKTRKSEILKQLKKAEDALNECENELVEVDSELRRFSDKEQIIKWHTERITHQNLLKKNQNTLAIYNYQLEEAEGNLAEAKSKLKTALSKEKECEQLNSIIDFAVKSQDVVTQIEVEMMHEVRERMENRTMEYFKNLIWKKGIYDHIVLDEQYQLDLIHRDGYPCVGSCSAAERSLLALAFTLALHEVSGFNSLLFIDTPVARVSGENRHNFAEVLKHVSENKQLILAFTPDEYSEKIQTIFKPIASTTVHLHMVDTNDKTIFE